MKTEDVIRMAREAGFVTGSRDYMCGGGAFLFVQAISQESFLVELERFASLVAAAEREECAKICRKVSARLNVASAPTTNQS